MNYKYSYLLTLAFLTACTKGSDTNDTDVVDTDTDVTDTDTDTGSVDTDTDDTDTNDTDTGTPDTGDTDTPDTGDTGSAPVWELPACGTVDGTAAVSFTADYGATIAPTSSTLTGTVYTWGLAVLPDDPGRIYAESGGRVLESLDDGCTWTDLGAAPQTLTHLVAAGVGKAYGWADNSGTLLTIDHETLTTSKLPSTDIVGFGVDPTDPMHLRAGTTGGVQYESTDGGASWGKGTPPPAADMWAYRWAYSPTDFDRVLIGTMSGGAWVTDDGGHSWTASTGLSSGSSNVFTAVWSPVDRNVVWAEGIDLVEDMDDGNGRHIWLSTDGGLTFSTVVSEEGDVVLVNGPVMAADPADANVLFFEFGTYYMDYGTDLWRYDAATGDLVRTHNDYDGIDAIQFSPADPTFMYVSFESVVVF